MSLWPREEYRIVLRPHHLVLVRMTRKFTRQGLKRHVLEKKILSCGSMTDKGMPWHGALKALEATLPELAERDSSATVILSNHFVRYALIPWSDALNGEKEEMAYAQHIFKEMYGSDPSTYDLRISSCGAGKMQIASAVDMRLLGALRDMFGRLKVDLKAIQPHLMLAYNSCFTDLRHRSAWLALVENGNLCLALLQHGHWSWIRMMRVGAHWHKELPFLLNREAFVANIENNVDDVLLWAPDHREIPVDSGGRWNIQYLRPSIMPCFGTELGNRFVVYMSE